MTSQYDHHPIYIQTPDYTERSGGIRALYHLCHYLNKTGFHAFVVSNTHPAPSRFAAPPLTESARQDHFDRGCEPIAVYGECVIGNPLNATIVVRYLLNKSGLLVPQAPLSYGVNDFFVHFDAAHVPTDRDSIDLFMPVVDRSIYFPGEHGRGRRGFVLCSHRAALENVELPSWVHPVVTATMMNPLSHQDLAQLYRQSRAMITLERTVAIFESLCCGCPVICIPGAHFARETYQPRFHGAGLSWGWNEQHLSLASARTTEFLNLYQTLEQAAPRRVHEVFCSIIEEARKRRPATDFQMRRAAS